MSLSNLPIFCCPTLAQLARMISTCPHLQTLYLERIMIPTSTDVMLPEPVALDHLGTLVLKEVDITRVLPILSPGPSELGVQIRDITDDANTLESWYSFAGKANICELDLTLSKTRSNQALARLLYSAISLLPSLRCLTLVDMDLRDSELIAVAGHFLAQDNQTLSSFSISTAGGLSSMNSLRLWSCTIRATSTALHNVVTAIHCTDLRLAFCNYLLITQGEDGITETLEPISVESDFGIRLCGLMPNRVSFD
ncbi:hypothetical protein BDV93DRAFT_524658 [Ceratobasidium sp. AG-I]|nr:hypothetical protein BDV93DRAFT_524658 [Ceratobasidium sp. AG-I]